MCEDDEHGDLAFAVLLHVFEGDIHARGARTDLEVREHLSDAFQPVSSPGADLGSSIRPPVRLILSPSSFS